MKGKTLYPPKKGKVLKRPVKGKPYVSPYAPRKITPKPGIYSPQRAPAAPAPRPPGPQGLPFDATYNAQVSTLNRQDQLNQANSLYQQGQVKQEYGFDDPSNPFSRAAMLQRAYQQGTQQRLNSAGNNLYSSSFGQNENFARFGHEQSVDTARRSYAQALQAIAQGQSQSTLDREQGVLMAGAERLERAPRAEDPGVPAVAPVVRAPVKAKPKPKSVRQRQAEASAKARARAVAQRQRERQRQQKYGRR